MSTKYKYLTLQDRKDISGQYLRGDRVLDIALALGVHPATIYLELKRGRTDELDKNQRPHYDPIQAQRVIQEGFRRRGHRCK